MESKRGKEACRREHEIREEDPEFLCRRVARSERLRFLSDYT
jgi:hypothetical protein